ncbi:MAG TPA: hypothetical protein VHW23_48060 [Kofleriaceae bacterium]|jgi:hypothetical protein|nr:hypothetical protein [Kofleriaceae bacterium]
MPDPRIQRRAVTYAIPLALLIAHSAGAAPAARPTRIVILGVAHSGAQLVAPAQQPAAFRAFIDRVKPDAICIERAPEEFARGDFYEFTYEQQDIVVPFARERRIPLYPIDWLPRGDDERLAFGIDLEQPPLVRPARGFQSFGTHDAAQLTAKLFFAETAASRAEGRDFASQPPPRPRFDFARRMFLYRTFMQAMRIAAAARRYPGGTVLVVIGSMHKDDIEHVLADEAGVEIAQPSAFGEPTQGELRAALRPADRFMIATFNLLGLQARTAVDWAWLRSIVGELAAAGGHEAPLFAIRLDYLTAKLAPADALARYEALDHATAATETFHWTGVKYASRLDSVFDPFGNVTIKQRIQIEIARLAHALGNDARTQAIADALAAQLSVTQAAQLRAYWKPYVLDLP